MSHGLNNREDELKKLYRTPANLRLKYWALASISVLIVLFLAMIIWVDDISYKWWMFMRGCAGLFAIIFVLLCAILVYRVNRDLFAKNV